MSKSVQTRRSTTKKHIIANREATHGEQNAPRNVKRQETEQTSQSNPTKARNLAEEVNPKYTVVAQRGSLLETCPVAVDVQPSDECECNVGVKRKCPACALLGSRQTNVFRHKTDLEDVAHVDPDYHGYAWMSNCEALDDTRLPWEPRVRNSTTINNEQRLRSDGRGLAKVDLWDQMQRLLASSEEIFPSADQDYDDGDLTGLRMIPDLDDTFVEKL